MGSSGCVKTAIRRAAGRACFSTASRFPAMWPAAFDAPVTEPPGRFRLGTNPEPTGSPTRAITIGIFVFVSMAAWVPGVCSATMTSTLARTNSLASDGSRSSLPSAERTSNAIFWPSRYPSFSRPGSNARRRPSGSDGVNRPTTRTRSPCCAPATGGNVSGITTAPPTTLRNSRRFMSAPWLRTRHRSGSQRYSGRDWAMSALGLGVPGRRSSPRSIARRQVTRRGASLRRGGSNCGIRGSYRCPHDCSDRPERHCNTGLQSRGCSAGRVRAMSLWPMGCRNINAGKPQA